MARIYDHNQDWEIFAESETKGLSLDMNALSENHYTGSYYQNYYHFTFFSIDI